MPDLLHEDVTFEIIGAAMEVHRTLGPGFVESIYQRAMEAELEKRRVAFESQKRITITYKDTVLGEHVLDLVVADAVVVELKAAKELTEQHQAQTLSYLKATGLQVGLLINFAKASLQHRRIVFTEVHAG